jgi:hypothetical protein
MHERALEISEPSCVPRTAKLFFIHVVHIPPGVVGHVAALELPSQEGRARGYGTHGDAGAHLSKEVRFRAEEHVAAPELTSARRRGPGPQDTWWLRSPPLQGGVARSYNLRGNVWMHALLLVLTQRLYVGVPSLQGADRSRHSRTTCDTSHVRYGMTY